MRAGLASRRYALDVMLGKLAKWLRILGFDTLNEPFVSTRQLLAWYNRGYLPVTRNRRWCGCVKAIYLKSNDAMEQLRELVILESINQEEISLFCRCLRCNDLLACVSREEVIGLVPDYIYETNNSFSRCPTCLGIYWPGTHVNRIRQVLEKEFGWSWQFVDEGEGGTR